MIPTALAWLLPLPLLVLALNVLPDPAGARWSLAGLRVAASSGPHGVAAFLGALVADLRALPVLGVGLLGLVLAAQRDARRWAWPALCLLLATLEPVRQRGAIPGMLYPFLPAAPLAALGLALPLERALAWGGAARAALALLLLAAAARPLSTDLLERWSVDPGRVDELKAFLLAHGTGPVCGLPNFNWRLEPELAACEPYEIGAAEGRASGFYAPGAPPSRFAGPAAVAELRYAVLCRVHFLGALELEGAALSLLEMERQGWPLVFDNRAFKVFENPRFGAVADPAVRLLASPANYAAAAGQARRAGRPDAERFALARAAAP